MKIVVTIVSVFISAVILFAFVPMFIQATYETEDYTNDGAGWVRFKYATGTSTEIEVNISDGVLYLGGIAPQSGPVEDMIIWADNNLSVYIKDGTPYYIGGNAGNVTTGSLNDNFTISKLSNSVRITNGEDTFNFPASSWAFIPNANGGYSSFDNGVSSHLNNDNISRPFVGGLLGLYTYDDLNTGGYDLSLNVDMDGDIINGAEWTNN